MTAKNQRQQMFWIGAFGLLLSIIAVLWCAMAQAASDATMIAADNDWLVKLSIVFGNVLMAAVSWLLTTLQKRVKGEWASGVISRSAAFVSIALRELYQTEIQAIKEARADGKLTDEEKARFAQIAIDKAKSYLGAKGLGELLKILGTGEKVDQFLKATLEAGIAAEKSAARPT